MKNKEKERDEKKSVLVAMSGGVDSAAAALILKEKGFDVTGIHFVLIDGVGCSSKVQKVADQIGIPLIFEDISKIFKEKVIDNFNSEYGKGRTPNPCVVCNPLVKFSKLLEVAEQKKFSNVATGHYACVEKSTKGMLLRKAFDETKDQSYFLHRLSQREIARTLFPLCEMRKKQVKKYVEKKGVKIEDGESQDVCFFNAKESLNTFLEKSITKRRGVIVDEKDACLGFHQGEEFFTIGQRHGLDINGGPFYVIEKVIEENKIIVSRNRNHPKLLARKILIKGVSWILDEPSEKIKYEIKTRYLCSETQGIIEVVNNDWVVTLDDPQWAVSPGQSLVLYNGEYIVGGGFIEKIIID